MRDDERTAVLELALEAFDDAVAPDYSVEGVAEFERAARGFLLDAAEGHVTHVAEEDGAFAGMIDVRDASHICLFFVGAGHRGAGVGSALLAAATAAALAADPDLRSMTVNSAPGAVGAYERFGFTATGPEQELNGIRYVAMRKELTAR